MLISKLCGSPTFASVGVSSPPQPTLRTISKKSKRREDEP